MLDLQRWRVPVAVILLVAVAARLGAEIAGVVGTAAGHSGTPTYLLGLAVGAGDTVLFVALAAVCAWCAADGVRGGRVFATVGFVLVACQVLSAIGAAIASAVLQGGAAAPRIATLVWQLSWLVVPILAAAVMLRSALPRPAVGSTRPGAAEVSPAQPVQSSLEQPVEQPYRETAGWEPHEAAGAAWTTAGEAAQGEAASEWGDAGSGWEPTKWSGRPAVDQSPDEPPV